MNTSEITTKQLPDLTKEEAIAKLYLMGFEVTGNRFWYRLATPNGIHSSTLISITLDVCRDGSPDIQFNDNHGRTFFVQFRSLLREVEYRIYGTRHTRRHEP